MADVTVELGNAYIGSAYSPQVEITETATGHQIDFTFADSEHPGQLTTEGFEVPSYASEEEAREAAEAARAAAEGAREAAEQARDAAESARASAEAGRAEAEGDREDAEAARASAEQARAAAETARASAEGSRASAEQGRASAEAARASAEAGRAAAESARATAEAGRASAETARASAEAARQQAEAARQTDTAAAIASAQAATSAANTATANAQAATTAAQAATSAADTATDAANAAAELATTAAETVTDAYFPGLAAGSADGVTGGGPTDSAAWLERTCPGTDGPATIESIHGRTVRWNQLAARRFTDVKVSNGVSFDYTQKDVISISGTATANVGFALIPNAATVVGHKYFVRAQVEGATIDSTSGYAVYLSPSTAFNGNMRMPAEGRIYTSTETRDDANLIFSAPNGTNFSDALHSRPQFFDLTAMFGSGNEPSTVAEFEALYPEPYYPYDAGSLLSVQMEGIESADADSNVIQTRTIPATDLRSAGTVYDELTATERITRVGERAYQSGDESDPTVTTDGTTTHYPLTSPTVTPIDPPLNLTYRAARGGTERITHTDPTAPPTLVVTYGSTADGIRDRALACIAHIENGKASANYGVGSYLIHGGQLCRVTTAIAAGEAIAIGTNVTATTVMAELLTLTQ